jgi:hypothetical protein
MVKIISFVGCLLLFAANCAHAQPLGTLHGKWMICADKVHSAPDAWAYNVFECNTNNGKPVWLRLAHHDDCSADTCLDAPEQDEIWHTNDTTSDECGSNTGFVINTGDQPTSFNDSVGVIEACDKTEDGYCGCYNISGGGPDDQPVAQQCSFVNGSKVCE